MADEATPKPRSKKAKAPAKPSGPTRRDLYDARQEMNDAAVGLSNAKRNLKAAKALNTLEHRIFLVGQRQAELNEAEGRFLKSKDRFEETRRALRAREGITR